VLLDRHTEVRTLDRLLGDVRGGQSRALVLRGEAGVGKTQLLEYLVDRAAGFWLMRAITSSWPRLVNGRTPRRPTLPIATARRC